jgi:hypothetical protein
MLSISERRESPRCYISLPVCTLRPRVVGVCIVREQCTSFVLSVMIDLIQGKYIGENDEVVVPLRKGTKLYTMLSHEFMERKRPQKSEVRF